jgi:hypothetical protein
VNLRVYFWVDITKYSHQKVRSAVIRLTKRAFARAGISMPDEAREVVFPKGVPVRLLSGEEGAAGTPDAARALQRARGSAPATEPAAQAAAAESDASASCAEGGLLSEAAEIERQGREARTPEGGANLLS